MAKPFLFRCPTTGMHVQGLADSDANAAGTFLAQACMACGQMHLVDARSGKLLAEAIEKRQSQDD